jgi:hypothetical protein
VRNCALLDRAFFPEMPLVDERSQYWLGGRHDHWAGRCLSGQLCAIRRCHLLLVTRTDSQVVTPSRNFDVSLDP